MNELKPEDLPLMADMFDDTTGYGSKLYGAAGHGSGGRGNTSKQKMEAYIEAFAGDAVRSALAFGNLTRDEMHSEIRRIYKHLAVHMRHLDKKAGSTTPNALRGLKRFLAYKNAPSTESAPIEEVAAKVTIPILDTAHPQTNHIQNDEQGVTLHRTAQDRTKAAATARSFDPNSMLNEAIAFIAKHFKGSDPQHSVIQEQKRFMKYGTDWHDVLRQAREGRGKMTQSQQYHVLGIDMYRQKLEHERRQRGMASAIQRGKKPTSREASPEPPPMPAPQACRYHPHHRHRDPSKNL
jgi:hypothetical protein